MNSEAPAMPIDETLARYSDLLYGTAMTVYVVAVILFLGALAAVRGRRLEQKQLVNAGARGTEARMPGRVDESSRRTLGEKLGNMGLPVVVVGLAAHIGSIVLRGIATDRAPWGNMYEFISMTCAAGVLAGLVILRKREHRPLLSFVLLPVILLMFIAGRWLYTQAAPVVPALKSYWLAVHVSIISVSSGILLVSGVASILYLIKMRWAANSPDDSAAVSTRPGLAGAVRRVVEHLPSAEQLDRLAYKCVVIGFPLFGLGVICGAIWAEAAWGRFWGWDPKETVSFIAWVIYAAYLHARATAGWRNNAAAWINVAGFVAMLFNLFIINLVVSGLHSYAGL
ncbi:c-type cytochrome biogenesis protein CcsB [Gordonia terrae]|uniref:C-type cytochrome biogenesis protein CcsB n=2 Tax=Gordonia terrae TaxID=2055 RepID=A0AAD0NXD1_9ACTN|nr:c-type cytochrome biogenesis protein CcsB [Gordonia terrae]VTR09788.1 Cytochrome c-type biogenesis protein CcmF [Clostridioides difficile]ANY22373.1 c-type cytochrome biogenesis protein CcsB [Gordonia terrae]AWO83110.1 c-type cytochrome biogenesis protein CcsB [Gordonia terrae]VTS33094.1 Cytochrome c-type biogenesis protein CcmF [Gordonia terrae]GAB43122.1 cytochrome c biogenesis protein ResC [Gordonia terrae NBRC 100016]